MPGPPPLPPMRAVGQSAPQPTTNDLYEKYHASFVRPSRCSSQTTLPAVLSTSPSSNPLLKAGAEGKLLVPKLKSMAPQRSFSNVNVSHSPRRSSLLAQSSRNSDASSEYSSRRGSHTSGRHQESSSWSYDGVHTYPALQRPSRFEKKMERVWVPASSNTSEVPGQGEGTWETKEVEVPVYEERKRLFLFAH